MLLSNTRRAVTSVFFLMVLITGAVLPVVAQATAAPRVLAQAAPLPAGNGGTGGVALPAGNSGAAQSNCGRGRGQAIANPLKFCSLEGLLDAILDAAIKLGTVILTLALIYTGFLFVAARGNEEKIKKARTALLYTIIGGLILLGSKAIQVVISDTVNSLTP